ncbi:hypothetical protein PN477_12560, partial [Spirulina subsalsa CS-330]
MFRTRTTLLTLLVLLVSPAIARAEGSVDLIRNGGDRPYLLYRDTPDPDSGNISREPIIKVYAQAGETIYMGSSAVGVGQGLTDSAGNGVWIRYRRAGETEWTSCDNTLGFIANRDQELAGPDPDGTKGGYKPCEIPSTATTTNGIWEVQFISPKPDAPDGSTYAPQNPETCSRTDWCQIPGVEAYEDDFFVAAWDVTVKEAPKGRVFANYLPLRVSTTDTTKEIASKLITLTKDGYQYEVNFNNLQPQGFIFFANNKGFTSANNPQFKSVQLPATFHSPELPDNLITDDITHKLFFNIPDNQTNDASIPGDWWLRTPDPPPDPEQFRFQGEEGTVGQAGTNPLTGAFYFNNPSTTRRFTYRIGLDVDQDGIITTNGRDVILIGTAETGENKVEWDGKDGQGNPIPAGATPYQATVTLFGGEAHFPLMDVEKNPNGLIITRCDEAVRTSCVPSTTAPNTVFYNDLDLGGGQAILGTSSASGAHKWTGSDLGFGDLRGIDTWVSIPSQSIPLQDSIIIKQTNLVTDKQAVGSDFFPGDEINYTLTVKNNGPSDLLPTTANDPATGPPSEDRALVTDTFPSGIENVTWTCTISTIAAPNTPLRNCDTASGSGDISEYVSLAAGEQANFAITGAIASTVTAGTTITNSATSRVPNDVTDPSTDPNSQKDNTDDAAITIGTPTTADLSLDKTVSANTVGSTTTVTYTLTVNNAGEANVTGAAVVDDVPDTLTNVQWTCTASAGSACGAASGTGDLNTTVDLPKDGSAVYTITGDVPSTFNGTLTNSAEIVPPAGITDPTTSNNTGNAPIILPVNTADLSLNKTVSANTVGSTTTVTYTLTVNNAGEANVTGAAVVDDVPDTLTNVQWTCTASSGSACGAASGTGDLNTTADLQKDGSAIYTITGDVPSTFNGTLTNNASVAPPAGITDPNNANNDDAEDIILPLNTADLSLNKTVSANTVGSTTTVTYTLTVNNAGEANVTGAAVVDDVPDTLTNVQWTCT